MAGVSSSLGTPHALDPQGKAVFFSVGSRSFVFNGHNGLFLDDIPPEVAEILARDGDSSSWAGVLRRSGWWDWLESYRKGEHPDLDPEERQKGFLENGPPGSYVVCLAQACNLACTYCVNQRGSYGGPARLMKPATARACVDFFHQQLTRDDCPRLSAVLFGGEPLLARESTRIVVEGLLEARRRSGKRTGALLCTNGTVWDEALFRTFAENADAFSVAISIDGGRESHDRNRPFASGKGESSWAAALETVRRLVERGVRVSATCVVPAPYDYIDRARELHATGVRRLEIKLVIPHIYGSSKTPDVLRTDFEEWRGKYLAYTEWCLERGGLLPPGEVVHNDRVTLLRESSDRLDYASSRRLGCSAGDEGAAIDVEGRIFPCDAFLPHPQTAIGTVTQGIDPEKHSTLARWLLEKGQHRIDAPRCSACFAKRFCGGGCYATSYDLSGKLEPMDDASCAFVRQKVLIDLYFISRVQKENPAGVARVFEGR